MRYITQRDNFRCAPIAFCNALKFQGYRVTWKHVLKLAEAMETCPEKPGTYRCNILRTAKGFGYPRMRAPTVEKISQFLKLGHAVIARYDVGPKNGHVVLFAGIDRWNRILVVNMFTSGPRWVKRSYIRKTCSGDLVAFRVYTTIFSPGVL